MNMLCNTPLITLLIWLIVVTAISIISHNIIKLINSHITNNRVLDEYRLAADFFLNKKEEITIENYLNERFDNYRIMNTLDDKDYYTDIDTENLINKFYIYSLSTMSPFLLKYFSLTYNVDKLNDIIRDQCTLIILLFITDKNRE